jgi:hypothetical protein
MPTLLVLAPCWLDSRSYQPGETIQFDGPPPAVLHPLDREARALRADVLRRRTPEQQKRDALLAARAKRGLPRHIRMQLDRADAEAAAEGPVEPRPAVRRRSVRLADTPETYPSAWSTRVNRLRSAVINPR